MVWYSLVRNKYTAEVIQNFDVSKGNVSNNVNLKQQGINY